MSDPVSGGEYLELHNGDTALTSDYCGEPSSDRRDVGHLFDCANSDAALFSTTVGNISAR
jgi:hypothetical protein